MAKTKIVFPTPFGEIEVPLPPLPFPLSKESNPGDPVAAPTLTLTLSVVDWDVEVLVMVKPPTGETVHASAGQVEVRLVDIGEPVLTTVYNSTPWVKTDSAGKVYFRHATYDWIYGWEALTYSNRYTIEARLVATPTVTAAKTLWLGLTKWADPPA